MTVRWGIIGIGKVADIAIAPAIGADDKGSLAAVCSRSLDRATAFAAKHGATAAYEDYAQMLADPDVDVVYIASPNGLHAEHGLAALKSGKHVLVDKPLALDIAEARSMVDAAADADVLLGTGFHLRHKATARAARDAIAAGRLGGVFYAEMACGAGKGLYPYDTWRADPALSGGGTLLHQGVHAVDLVAYLCDQPVVEVTAMFDKPGAEDVFVGSCRLADGTLANIASHSLRMGTRPDWTVFGTGGWLDARGGTSPAPDDTLDLHDDEGTSRLATSTSPAYVTEVADFSAAVASATEPIASGVDGLRAVAVADALYRAADERRSVTVEIL
ncbi:Gfo/Idh/MocA family protein [Mycolicibacterium stellerae]|uniref:Gfo/Idh/MocA family protein n=1 Tax=Mycolicibacterium stellerae TaxID=2358193 RepID=UPI000F0B42D2|nr:Gfo/Idh/MocA family oxidoreductase [Mycolicibacterium stellerae]